jgi:hypothetical protein
MVFFRQLTALATVASFGLTYPLSSGFLVVAAEQGQAKSSVKELPALVRAEVERVFAEFSKEGVKVFDSNGRPISKAQLMNSESFDYFAVKKGVKFAQRVKVEADSKSQKLILTIGLYDLDLKTIKANSEAEIDLSRSEVENRITLERALQDIQNQYDSGIFSFLKTIKEFFIPTVHAGSGNPLLLFIGFGIAVGGSIACRSITAGKGNLAGGCMVLAFCLGIGLMIASASSSSKN